MSVLDLISNDPYPLVLPFRLIQITGRYGGGKTALGVHWCRRLAADGHIAYVCANIPLALPVVAEYDDRPRDLRYVAYLVDEGWQYLGLDATPTAIKRELAYLRKFGNFILLPSVIPLTRHISGFPVVTFVFSFSRIVGLHWWVYWWSVGFGKLASTGYWWWLTPVTVWGIYDSSYIPTDRWWLYDVTGWRGYDLKTWASKNGLDYEAIAVQSCGQ
jgi:hypothetical protein